jgi:Ig-like domain from next to BRCA1 gene
MFYAKKSMLFMLTTLVLVALTGCNLGQAAEPTATAIDLNAVKTSAAAAAFVELTKIAAAIPPTATATIVLTETPTQAPSNTLEPGSLPPTETPLVIGGGSAITTTPIASFTPSSLGDSTGGSTGGSGGPVCKNSQYGGDITIPDGTVMKPWQKFTKAWTIRNTGTCTWDEGFYFAGWSGPPSMGPNQEPYRIKTSNNFVEGGGAVNIYISMYAPGDPGDYVAHWSMYDDQGKQFGGDFTVVIKVVK